MRQLISAMRRRLAPPTETLEGYEHPELVEVHFQKTKAYAPKEPWPEMVGVSSVLDFGGACGIHYKRAALQNPLTRWAVVETPAMVARASLLSTDRLRFFTSIPEAANWLGPIGVMHSNGALQYVPEPEQTLKQLCSLRASKMLWYRVALSATSVEREIQTSRLGDNGPGQLPNLKQKTVQYDRTRIPESAFLSAHVMGYTLASRGEDWFQFSLK